MARSSSPLAQYVVLGVIGLFAFNWAEKQPVGSSARNTADQLKGLLHKGSPTSAASVSAQPGFTQQRIGEQTASQAQQGEIARPGGGVYIATYLIDYGQQALVFDPTINSLRQDPTQGGTNSYGAGDLVIDARDNRGWIYQGGTSFYDQSTGELQGLTHFEAQ